MYELQKQGYDWNNAVEVKPDVVRVRYGESLDYVYDVSRKGDVFEVSLYIEGKAGQLTEVQPVILLAAKRLATANAEHWDNWQGVHVPNIYKIEDTKTIISKGRLTSNDGQEIRIPVGKPFATKNIKTNKWEYC